MYVTTACTIKSIEFNGIFVKDQKYAALKYKYFDIKKM